MWQSQSPAATPTVILCGDAHRGDAYESMKREDRPGIATVARKHTQKQGMEVSALIFQ